MELKKQQQMRSYSKLYNHGGGGEPALLGSGLSKLALAVCTACACSFFYIALVLLTTTTLSSCNPSSSTRSTPRFMSHNLNLHAILDHNATTLPHRFIPRNTTSGNATSWNPPAPSSSSPKSISLAASKSPISSPPARPSTSLHNIVFGIAASARLWERRREYVKLWWNSTTMRGFVWLDKKPRRKWSNADFPRGRISSPFSGFNYTNKMGSRAAIRISRIVSETYRMGLPDVHWFVMGDDDTVFLPENLLRVLSKYDHTKMYYIGSSSESHTQNLHFSYNMAYGGGGFAISHPLARALERMQDACLHRYPYLFGSDDRIQACMAELGVPLTKEPGFHQFDIYGDAFGLLSAHPVSPLVSLHHLDVIHPLFPNMTQVQSLKNLKRAIGVDSAGVLQQSICYDKWRKWSFSVSWGYAVQVHRGILPPRELELPSRTFISWYRRTEDSGFPFSTRGVSQNPCEQPTVFYMNKVGLKNADTSLSTYMRESKRRGDCKWRMASPGGLDWIRVHKELTDLYWHQAPRRHCCRVLNSNRKNVDIEVGPCRFGEFIV